MKQSSGCASCRELRSALNHSSNVCFTPKTINRTLGIAFALSFIIFHPLSYGSSAPDIHELLKETGRDGAYLLASPLRLGPQDIFPTVLIGGGVAATFAYDDNIRDHMAGLRKWEGRKNLVTMGDVLQYGGVIGGVGLYAYGKAEEDSRALSNAWLQLEGALFGGVAGQGIKFIVGRARPDASDPDADNFKPFSLQDSYPSGHTLNAFIAAQLAAEEYPSYGVRIPVYLLATGTGVSRLAADKHWGADVVASAILGIVMGHTLYRVHQRPASDWRLLVETGGLKIAGSF